MYMLKQLLSVLSEKMVYCQMCGDYLLFFPFPLREDTFLFNTFKIVLPRMLCTNLSTEDISELCSFVQKPTNNQRKCPTCIKLTKLLDFLKEENFAKTHLNKQVLKYRSEI